jgi:hypothetical protein
MIENLFFFQKQNKFLFMESLLLPITTPKQKQKKKQTQTSPLISTILQNKQQVIVPTETRFLCVVIAWFVLWTCVILFSPAFSLVMLIPAILFVLFMTLCSVLLTYITMGLLDWICMFPGQPVFMSKTFCPVIRSINKTIGNDNNLIGNYSILLLVIVATIWIIYDYFFHKKVNNNIEKID